MTEGTPSGRRRPGDRADPAGGEPMARSRRPGRASTPTRRLDRDRDTDERSDPDAGPDRATDAGPDAGADRPILTPEPDAAIARPIRRRTRRRTDTSRSRPVPSTGVTDPPPTSDH